MPSSLLPADNLLPADILSGSRVSWKTAAPDHARGLGRWLKLILLLCLLSFGLLRSPMTFAQTAAIPLPGAAQDLSTYPPIGTSADNNTRLLWAGSNGTVTLWNTKPDGTFVSRVSFGPYAGWTPTHVAVGSDGRAHVLWVNTNGSISLFSVDMAAATFTYYAYGPYAGWSATGLAVGPDNKTRVLWNNTDGSVDLWDQDSGTGNFTVHTFGPYSDSGGAWTARAIAVGSDNKTRVIWSQSGGTLALWSVDDSTWAYTAQFYGPYAGGYTPQFVAMGPDGKTRILWTRADGGIILWNLDPSTNNFTLFQHDPISGWAVKGIAVGQDNKTRMLWANTDGSAALWSVDTVAGTFTLNFYPSLATVSAPGSVVAGQSATGTVTLNVGAGSNGAPVTLSSSSPSVASVPASVTVAAGADTATFPITANRVTVATPVMLTASCNGVTQTTTITVNPMADDATFGSQQVPTTMTTGQTYSVPVVMNNVGTNTWIGTGNNPYTLVSQNPLNTPRWTVQLMSVSGSVTTGQAATFRLTVTAPSTPGTYNFQWGMVHQGIAPFGDLSTNVPIQVNAPTLTSIAVSPATASLPLNAPLSFTAVAKDQNGNALSPQPSLAWSLDSGGVGSINVGSGLYASSGTPGSATVRATSGSVSGTGTVTVTNAAPTVATQAQASPSPVTGTSTSLSVLGADDGGEANLTYTWATTGTPPAPVTFSTNNTNAAKNVTATFTQAGTYTFQVTLTDAQGATTTSGPVTVTVGQTATTLSLSPSSATVTAGTTQQFTGTVKDQFGMALATQPTLTWSAVSGTISTSGLYTAPASGSSDTVQAVSGSLSAQATVTINPAPPTVATRAQASPNPVTGTTTSLSVLGADVTGESNLTYTWATTGSSPSGVTYSANSTNAAKNTTATFTQAGTYNFQVTIKNGAGLTTPSTVTVNVNLTLTGIAVSPTSAALNLNGIQTFTASAQDQFGNALTPQPTFTWSLVSGGVGSVSSSGVYSAGTTPGSATVQATSGSQSGTATVSVTDAAPVISSVTANPNPATGTTTSLTVVATDDGGEPNLTYSWATTGTPPAPVTFSANGTNAAKNVTATFTKSGAYSFQVTLTDAQGLTATSSVSVTVNQTATTLSLSPSSATVTVSTTQQFTGTVKDQFGSALIPQPALSWSVTAGSGTVSTSGVYTAPSATGSATVQATTSGSLSGTATVTVSNAVPTVATAAQASPSPVTGTTTNLSVLGADNGGESNLTYTWTTTGTSPSGVTYSANGTNAAKNTTATFTQAGTYAFQATITNAQGAAVTSSVTVTVNQTLTSVVVSPATAALNLNATKTFTATAKDQFGLALTPQPTPVWSVDSGGVGTVTSSGVYSAGTTPGSATVRATSGSVSGTGAVTVTNAAPTVATQAQATPAPVTGTTTALSVLGSDDGGEANLTYTWTTTATPPAPVTFSANNTNAAKNTTATFTKSGAYTFRVTLQDAQGLTNTSSVSVTVNATLTSISVSPAPAQVPAGATQRFTATALDQFGNALSSQPVFTWSVPTGRGTISASGLYTAPSTAGSDTVQASSGSVSGVASVSIVLAPPVLSGSTSGTTATLLLTRSTGATTYRVYRGNTLLASLPDTGASSYTVTDTNLAHGQVYTYWVVASNGSADSASSNVITLVVVPDPPANLTAVPGYAQVLLSWTPPTGTVDNYLILRSTTNGGPYVTVATTRGTTYDDTGLTNGTSYYYVVQASNAGGVSASTAQATATPQVNAALYRINAGGDQYVDSTQATWTADQGFTGGSVVTTANPIDRTSDPALYQVQRAGASFSYSLPLSNGTYVVNLLFAEVEGNGLGQRVFNVTANGQALNNFDIFAAANGGNRAVSRSLLVSVTNGTLNLSFTGLNGSAATVAGIQVALPAGSVVADQPAPDWASDMIPSDEPDSPGAGPSSSQSVSLPSGVEENRPGADLWAFNPVGPSVAYERLYRSALAANGYGSPGLSAGWVDNYDRAVTALAPGTWGSLALRSPGGAVETWTPSAVPPGATSVSINPPAGSPYLITGIPSATVGQWQSFTVLFKDRSKNIYTPDPNDPNHYLLTGFVNLVGHAVAINRDAANGNRLVSLVNDDVAPSRPTSLLSFTYAGSSLASVQDGYGRQVSFTFTATPGVSGVTLTGVSQIYAATDPGPAPARWQYGYVAFGSAPFLSSVLAPNPSASGLAMVSASVSYFPNGSVQSHMDANQNQRLYDYGRSSTHVKVYGPTTSVPPLLQWNQNFGNRNLDTGTIDANGKSDAAAYGDAANPYLPTLVTNRNNQPASLTYDAFGNVVTATDSRNTTTTNSYDPASVFPLGQVNQVQEANTDPTTGTTITHSPTTYEYFGPSDVPTDGGPAGAIAGLLKAVHTPSQYAVNNNGAPQITTTYTYDRLGNVTKVTTPNANSSLTLGTPTTYQTTTYNYVSYNYTDTQGVGHTYAQSEALGEPVSVTVTGLDSTKDSNGANTVSTTVTYFQYDPRGNRTAVIDALGNETDFQYNLADQQTATLFPATGDSGTQQSKSMIAYQYPGGPASSSSVYDESGALFRHVNYVYGLEGELLSVSGDTYPISYGYDGLYRQASVTYYQQSLTTGATTFYDYDPVGNLAAVRYPGQTGATFDQHRYFYDPDNNLVKEIDGNNLEKDYQRFDPATQVPDPQSLLRTLHYVYPAGYAGSMIADVGYTYDAFGRRASMTDGTGSKSYTYYDPGNLSTETRNFAGGPQNHVTRFQYYADGSLASAYGSLSYTGSNGAYSYAPRANYRYDGIGRMQSEESREAVYNNVYNNAAYTYYSNGWLGQTNIYAVDNSSPSPTFQTFYGYNARGFLTNLENDQRLRNLNQNPSPLLSKFTNMAYDPVGNRLTETATIPSVVDIPRNGVAYATLPDASRTVAYSYNNRDELTGEQSQSIPSASNRNDSYAENYSFGFGYDLAGNATTFRGTAGTFNNDNQSRTITPDGNGNPVGYPNPATNQTSAFQYDPEDRLTNVPGMLTMAYDGDGLRAWKQDQTGTRTYYLYDGDTPFVEEYWPGKAYDPNSMLYEHIFGYGPAGLIYSAKSDPKQTDLTISETYAYDPQGNLVERLAGGYYPGVRDVVIFDAFGKIRSDCNFGNFSTQLGIPQGFGAQHGYYTDLETGLQLLTHRYYDAGTGRFVNRDPIGYKGGINLYGFAGNNPVNESDPEGTSNRFTRWLGRGWNKLNRLLWGGSAAGPHFGQGHGKDIGLDEDEKDGLSMLDAHPQQAAHELSSGINQVGGIVVIGALSAPLGGEGEAVEEAALASRVRFPFLKDHAMRHGDGLSAAQYLQDAVYNMVTGRRFLVRHDRSAKLAFVRRIGFDEFQFTSTSLNKRVILTHLKVNLKYLGNKGIRLPKDF